MSQLFELGDASKARKNITQKQQKEIIAMYTQLAKEAEAKAKKLEGMTGTTPSIEKVYLENMAKDLNNSVKRMQGVLEDKIKWNMYKASGAVVDAAVDFNAKAGINLAGAFSHVPEDIVTSLMQGKLYKGDWSLSSAIYSDIKRTQKDINSVVAQGLAMNKSSLEIAQDLTKYVDPSARKDWEWSKVYPGTKTKVDYAAQRLARTMTAHAYQQSLKETVKDNPFVDGIKWITTFGHRTCELCKERATQNDYGLGEGVFPKDKLPLDHPNGLCSFSAEITKDLEDIADELADWVEGKPNKGMDKYAKSMGYTPKKVKENVRKK